MYSEGDIQFHKVATGVDTQIQAYTYKQKTKQASLFEEVNNDDYL